MCSFDRLVIMVRHLAGDWHGRCPAFLRVGVHLTVVVLAVMAVGLSSLEWPAAGVAQSSGQSSEASTGHGNDPGAVVVRLPQPRTVIPKRPAPVLITPAISRTFFAGGAVAGIAAEGDARSLGSHNERPTVGAGEGSDQGQPRVVETCRCEAEDGPSSRTFVALEPMGSSYWACHGATVAGPVSTGKFIYPTGSRRVSGWHFHDPRNPVHAGLDYACGRGDSIYAADNGMVTMVEQSTVYGILIELDHANGFRTRYAHLQDVAVGCGQVVNQGDVVGYCGSTGASSGPHLHFEVRYRGVPQDPASHLPGIQTRSLPPVSEDWFAQFYNNEHLEGPPAATRRDSWIAFEWGADGPLRGVWGDGFSIRWTRRIRLNRGDYRFCAMSDDGVRIWVGGKLVLDEWHANSGIVYCGDYRAWTGYYDVKVEYYEHGGEALIYVWWDPQEAE